MPSDLQERLLWNCDGGKSESLFIKVIGMHCLFCRKYILEYSSDWKMDKPEIQLGTLSLGQTLKKLF